MTTILGAVEHLCLSSGSVSRTYQSLLFSCRPFAQLLGAAFLSHHPASKLDDRLRSMIQLHLSKSPITKGRGALNERSMVLPSTLIPVISLRTFEKASAGMNKIVRERSLFWKLAKEGALDVHFENPCDGRTLNGWR